MFALDASTDGKNFRPIFVQRRLRKYCAIKNAVMGAVKFVKNQLNHYKAIGIRDLEKNQYVCFVYEIENDKPKVEYVNESKQTKLNVNCESQKREDRIEFLKRCHELHEIKKSQRQEIEIKACETVNNLSDKETAQKSFEFYELFMASALDRAWKEKDARSLFRTELSLSAKGYSWYLDDDDKFIVKPTSQVLDFLNKKRKNNRHKFDC